MERQARRRKTAEPRRDELVRAAYRLLAERGFEGLRTRDVAAAVGLNIATLHYYFPTKEALVRGVVEHAQERFRATLAAKGRAGDLLRSHFEGLRCLGRDEPEIFAVMGELALRAARDPAIASIMKEMDQIWHATLRGLLRRAQEDDAIDKKVDVTDAAALIVATLKGVYLLPAGSPRQERLTQALRQLERWLGITRKTGERGIGRI
jgi:TetR/AcrR family transcriptional repressor of nem operon